VRTAVDERRRGREEERTGPRQQHALAGQDPLGLDEGRHASGRDDARQRPARHGRGPVVRPGRKDERARLYDPRAPGVVQEEHALRLHAPHLGAGADHRAGALEVVEERAALPSRAAERVPGPGGELGRELAVDLSARPRRVVEDEHLGTGRARFHGGADPGGPRPHDDDLVALDDAHGPSSSRAGIGRRARAEAALGLHDHAGPGGLEARAHVGLAVHDHPAVGQTPMAQKIPRGAPRWAVRRAVRRPAASSAVATVSPGYASIA
jgi:hypothetical protein